VQRLRLANTDRDHPRPHLNWAARGYVKNVRQARFAALNDRHARLRHQRAGHVLVERHAA
jgi:hypothetical protein